jgi:hypothetical protein
LVPYSPFNWLLAFKQLGGVYFLNGGITRKHSFGIARRGIGGLVVGSIWKAVNAAIIGGVIFALASLTILFVLIPCPFLGGC